MWEKLDEHVTGSDIIAESKAGCSGLYAHGKSLLT
jgi:hypothetical protein